MRDFGFQWHLTDRCNLRCAHCYQDDFSPQRELPLEALCNMVDNIFPALSGRRISVNLTGGEPFLFPGLLEVIRHLHHRPNLDEINLITNGTVTTTDLLEAIGAQGKVHYIKVSLESADLAINDEIRGAGNLARVRRNLPVLRQRTGRPLVLMMTLAMYNVASLRQTVEFARDEGFSGVIVERFVPLGQGDVLAEDVLDHAAWNEACETLIDIAGLDAGPSDLRPFRAFWLHTAGEQEGRLQGAACNLGDESMALMPNGDVYPCRRFPTTVGNVLKDPFERILERLAAHAPAKMRSRLHGPLCTNCGVKSCAGCRALALALTGDLGADDSQCAIP